jgi:gamma-glutamyltranspeptidase/glutathione hydrolase
MTPTVVREGGQTVRMVLGSPGGPRIISSVIEVILRAEVYGQSLADAVRAPRLHQQWTPAETTIEPGWDPRLLQDLQNRNHALCVSPERFGSVQAIRTEAGGRPEGVSDPRRGGAVGAEGGGISRPARPPEDPLGGG